MILWKLLDENRILTPLSSQNRDDIIREMVEALHRAKEIQNPQAVIQAVLDRERMESTGLCQGIAIPHACTSEVSGACVFLGISPGGIDFDSLDGEPSRLFFMILTDPDHGHQHIELLSQISRISSLGDLPENLCNAGDSRAVLSLLEAAGL